MKILIVGNGRRGPDEYPNPNAGASVQTWGVAQELSKRGHQIYLIRRGPDDFSNPNIILLGIDFFGLEDYFKSGVLHHFFLLMSKLMFSFMAIKYVIGCQPDVLFFIDRQSAFFLRDLNYPKIFVVHSPEAMSFYRAELIKSNKFNVFLYQSNIYFQNHLFKNVDIITTLNEYHEGYIKNLGFGNVMTIPNGVDQEVCTCDADDDYILYGGRLDSNKNVIELLDAFVSMRDKIKTMKLLIIGDGNLYSTILSGVNEENVSTIKMMKSVSRSSYLKYLSKCSLFVLPSFHETFPCSVLEAFACGKPVIARKNEGVINLVIPEYNGYLYDDISELRNYLLHLSLNSSIRQKMGKNAYLDVTSKYTFKRLAPRYEALLYEAITIHKKAPVSTSRYSAV